MERRYPRRQYLIAWDFQMRFILKFCAVVIVSTILIGTSILFLSRNSSIVISEGERLEIKKTIDFLLPELIMVTLVIIAISAIVTIALTMYMSHKIAGPLHRFRREIDSLKGGDLRRIFTLRTGDQMQDLAQSLNEMCDSLRSKLLELQNKWEGLKKSMQLRGFDAEREENVKLAEIMDEIDEILEFFKV